MHKFRLIPTVRQRRRLAKTAGSCRAFRNELIADDKDRFAKAEERFTIARSEEVRKEWRKSNNKGFAEVPAQVGQQVAQALDSDFACYRKKIREEPRFSVKGRNPDYFRMPNQGWRIDEYQHENGHAVYHIAFSKIGKVRIRLHRLLPEGKRGTMIVTRDDNRWYACIPIKRGISPEKHSGSDVGVDVGINKTAATWDTDGKAAEYHLKEHFAVDKRKRLEAKKKHYQREMSKKLDHALRALGWDGKSETRKAAAQKLGKKCREEKKAWVSGRYQILKKRAAKASRKITNCRHNARHHISKAIAEKHCRIAVEALKLANMTKSAKGTMEKPGKNVRQKAGLSREMLAVGLGGLRGMIAYKSIERGGEIIPVPPRNTSRECPECKHIDEKNRKGEAFKCVLCGYEADADINAARNILKLAQGFGVTARGGDGFIRPMKRRITPKSVH